MNTEGTYQCFCKIGYRKDRVDLKQVLKSNGLDQQESTDQEPSTVRGSLISYQ